MIKIVSVEAMRAIETAADAGGLSYDTMMQQAGRAVANRVLKALAENAPAEQARVTVLVGPGNNGGDGLVAARFIAAESDALVRCYLLKRRDEADPHLKAAQEAGLFIANAEDDQRYRVLFNMVASAHLIVDALFGIGVRLPLQGDAQKLLRQVQAALDAEPEEQDAGAVITTPGGTAPLLDHPRPYIVAVDVPSGLNSDTGEVDPLAIPADETVTFIAAKPGQFLFPGAAAVGNLSVAPLAVPQDIDGLKDEQRVLASAKDVRRLLPKRAPGSHKGTFGKALVVAGSVNYTGAPSLAAEACYRVGAGLVTVAAPGPVVSIISAFLREATWILLPHDMGVAAAGAADVVRKELSRYDALLVGPGLGRETTTGEMIERLLLSPAQEQRKRRVIGFGPQPVGSTPSEETPSELPRLVIDADGLFLLSQIEGWSARLPKDTILTPHPGEMGQLTGLSAQEVEADRWNLARAKAAEWNAIVLLKGAHTVIAAPDGRLTVLPFKTAALSTAGTGDVLAGMITGLLAQGLDAYDAAVAAGYLHGLAGQLMEEQMGTRAPVAGDLVSFSLPQALALIEPD